MGGSDAAVAKLREALDLDPESFDAWHALAEIHFQARQLDEALEAAQQAHRLKPDDIFVNTSLSRIWMERGDKFQAEHYGAQARLMGWKSELKGAPPESED